MKTGLYILEEDSTPTDTEHDCRVQLPCLQSLQPNLKFVPIALGTGRFEVDRSNSVCDCRLSLRAKLKFDP